MTREENVIAASDARTAKALYAQIEANQASLDPQYRLANDPSDWRIGHLRKAAINHPKQHLQPTFEPEYDPFVLPAIRLYTHFLDCALPIFHTLLLRKPALLPRKTLSEPRAWVYPEPLSDLTEEQEKYAWTYLGEMGKRVTWLVGVAGEGGLRSSTQGITHRRRDLSLRDAGLAGYGSTITTNLTMIQAVESATNVENRKLNMFRLAVLWMHETSHAVMNAVQPWDAATGWQVRFLGPGSSTSEEGFELENMLFGGRFEKCFNPILSTQMVLQEWPDVETLRHYQKNGVPILTRGTSERLTREWTVEWKVEPSHWQRMFEEDFWKKDLMVGRSKALWPAKNVGSLRKFVDRALTEEEKETLERKLEIEGCERRCNGLFVRKGLKLQMARYEPDSDETDETDSDGMGDVEMSELEDAEMTDAE